MKIRAIIRVGLFLVTALAGRAETGITNVIESGYVNHGGQYVVGESGPGNALVIRNEGWLENTTGIIGYEPGADGNLALVTGPSSLWDNRGPLRLGVLGSANSLVISNGGRVNLYGGVLGEDETSSGNSVLVTGAGSRWSSHALQIGLSGHSNLFTIAQGGQATSGNPYDAVGYNEPSYANRMVVDGSGSSFSGSGLAVGSFGSVGNELRILNGGQVVTVNGFTGNGSSNSVLISGPGSLWHNYAVFFHGMEGQGNRLLVTNGGRLACEGGYISGSDNIATITGTNSIWETGGNTGQLVVGEYGTGNEVNVLGGARLNTWDAYIVGSLNRVRLSGPGSRLHNVETFVVGEDFGQTNGLILSDRARLTTADITLAADYGTLSVSGPGTALDATGLLSVGDEYGRGNELLVLAGAQVNNGPGYLGGTASAFRFGDNRRNRALISGSGSLWMNRSNLTVGVTGPETELAVRDRGRVVNQTAFLGFYPYSPNNRAIVSDSGSSWESAGELYVGYASWNNRLIITNAATVTSGTGWVGRNFTEANTVLVSGTNSVWTIHGSLLVGNSGSGNRVTVAEGARLAAISASIDSPNGRSNSVVVSGPGAVLAVSSSLNLGTSSSLNHLLVENGGTLQAGAVNIGNSGVSVSNTLTVTHGRLLVTNSSGTATLSMREGALFLTAADVIVDRLQTFSGQSVVSLETGNARIQTLSLSAGTAAQLGNGQDGAQLQLGPAIHTLGSLTVASNATLILAGTVTGALTNGGLIEIGTNVAGVTMTGSITQTPSGAMAFDLGGTEQRTRHDFIQLDGTLHCAGLLRLRLSGGFVPSSNSVFTLLNARVITGAFANAPAGARVTFEGTALSCEVDYSGGALRLLNFHNAGPAGTNDIDEAWAIRYFGHSPLTEAERRGDADGDGLSNYHEYLAGTDPLDNRSALKILSVARHGAEPAVLEFSAATDRSYGIAYSSDLLTWNDVAAPSFISPAPGVLRWIDDGSLTGGLPAGRRFYRVLVR